MPTASLSSLPPQRGRPPTAGLRNAILRNAEAVFTGRDFHAVAMDDIALRSGVGKGTLYRYFANKQALFEAVMMEGLPELHARIRAAAGEAADPPARLATIVRTILQHFALRPGLVALIDREERKQAVARRWFGRRAELARLLGGVVEDGIRSGDFRRVEPRLAAEMLLGMVRAMNRYRTPRDSLAAAEGAVLGIFLDGVSVRRGERRGARRASPRRARS